MAGTAGVPPPEWARDCDGREREQEHFAARKHVAAAPFARDHEGLAACEVREHESMVGNIKRMSRLHGVANGRIA